MTVLYTDYRAIIEEWRYFTNRVEPEKDERVWRSVEFWWQDERAEFDGVVLAQRNQLLGDVQMRLRVILAVGYIYREVIFVHWQPRGAPGREPCSKQRERDSFTSFSKVDESI